MEYRKLWPNKSYFCLWFLHLEVIKLVCLMHIELLFPVVLCFCRCLWMPFILELVFLWPLWSLKLFSRAKEPFNKDLSFFPFLRNPWIWIATYVSFSVNVVIFRRLPTSIFWRQALKPIKIHINPQNAHYTMLWSTSQSNHFPHLLVKIT